MKREINQNKIQLDNSRYHIFISSVFTTHSLLLSTRKTVCREPQGLVLHLFLLDIVRPHVRGLRSHLAFGFSNLLARDTAWCNRLKVIGVPSTSDVYPSATFSFCSRLIGYLLPFIWLHLESKPHQNCINSTHNPHSINPHQIHTQSTSFFRRCVRT